MAIYTVGPKKALYSKSYGRFRVEVNLLLRYRAILYAMDGYIHPDYTDAYIDDLLEATRANGPIVAMIADPRKMKVLSADFQQAIQTRFWPGIAALGVKKNPGIVPPAAITQSSVKRMVKGAGETVTTPHGHQLRIALLDSLEDCLEWISSD